MPTSKKHVSALGEKITSSNIYELARSVSPAAFYASDWPLNSIPLVVTFWAANGDKSELQKLGFDFDQTIWRSFDVQPMAKCLRPHGKVATKGHNGQYRLIEASEEFGLCMTSQKMLLDQYADGEARKERYPVQHCAVEDAVNTVKLTGLLMTDLAEIDLMSGMYEGSPPKTVCPPDGFNTRNLSIDTESCCLPEDTNRPRGHKYPTFLSELGVAFIDTDTIRRNPVDWHEHITTAHAIIAEHWDHHPHRACQEKMGIDDRLPFYLRFSACSGPSGSCQEDRTFDVDGKTYTATMSPDTEIIFQDRCLEWLLAKIHQ